MTEDELIDMLHLERTWIDPWKRPLPDNVVAKPIYLFRYEGGFRMGRQNKVKRVRANYRQKIEFHRGAHP